MKNLKILPYRRNSLSSKAISRHFNSLRIFPDRNYRPKNGDVILNWGFCGDIPVLENFKTDFTILNYPMAVDCASDKVKTFTLLKENNVPHVEFTFSQEEALKWIEEGHLVYCRTLTRGKEGKGIVLAKTAPEVVKCDLYTKQFVNNHEYRIHVFNGEVTDMVEKRKMSTDRKADFARRGIRVENDDNGGVIRNLKKGYSFCREDLVISEEIQQIAINAITALGLDFGGVDMAYNDETGEAKVLEINTACGQKKATSTHARYVAAISKYLGVPFSINEYNRRYNCNLNHDLL